PEVVIAYTRVRLPGTTGVFHGFETRAFPATVCSSSRPRGAAMIDHHLQESDERVLSALIDEHVDVSCELIALDEHQWAIRGWIPVGGEALLARFENEADARAALDELEAAGLTPPRRATQTHPREDG